jgi:phosphotriesterase-related protein
MNRRELLKGLAAVAGGAAIGAAEGAAPALQVMTVKGPIAPDALGVTLPHEHVLVDFIGADKVSRDRYNPDEVFEVALPYLKQARGLGCQTLVECTPAYLGRDPALLRRLSDASGLHLLTNTGYYGAASDKYVPEHAFRETADQLAARWIAEWKDGIGDSGIRPGFIKIGVDSGTLSDIDRKIVTAAARAHLATGLTIGSHTGDGAAAMDQLDVLRKEGVDWSAFIWIHAQNEPNPDVHAKAAEGGAWVEFDGVGPDTVPRHVEAVVALRKRRLLRRVLLSQDAGWYHVGEPRGGKFRGYDHLFTHFLLELKNAGVLQNDVLQMTIANPREAFPVRVRKNQGS